MTRELLIDVYARTDSRKHEFYGYVTPEWARQWPPEEIWTARLTGVSER